jgi:cytoskeleton protein RodZ
MLSSLLQRGIRNLVPVLLGVAVNSLPVSFRPDELPTAFFGWRSGRLREDGFHCMAKGTFGERLKRERELREVSLDEVSKSTRISARFLQALENEDWQKLPGGVFGRGFVRTIARYLGLSEESLLAEYDLARGVSALASPPKPEDRIPSPPKWFPIAAVLVILLLLAGLLFGGIYGWRKIKARRLATQWQPSVTQTLPARSPVASNSQPPAPSTFAPPAKIPLELSVSTSTATHVRILADGNVVLDADLLAGQNRRFTATTLFEVSASDSSAVLLELNGNMIAPLGTPGSSGKIALSAKDLRQVPSGVSQP